jgi:hypothetical protein
MPLKNQCPVTLALSGAAVSVAASAAVRAARAGASSRGAGGKGLTSSEAVTDFPRPSTVQELQMFLGMVNFYRRFLPGAARALRPLTDCLRGGPKGPRWWSGRGVAGGRGHRDAE